MYHERCVQMFSYKQQSSVEVAHIWTRAWWAAGWGVQWWSKLRADRVHIDCHQWVQLKMTLLDQSAPGGGIQQIVCLYYYTDGLAGYKLARLLLARAEGCFTSTTQLTTTHYGPIICPQLPTVLTSFVQKLQIWGILWICESMGDEFNFVGRQIYSVT